MEFEEKLLDRTLYKKVKGMNRTEMEQTFKNLFTLGYEKALNEGAVELDTDKLRSELGQIKGIGENRLNEIMAVIEKNLLSE